MYQYETVSEISRFANAIKNQLILRDHSQVYYGRAFAVTLPTVERLKALPAFFPFHVLSHISEVVTSYMTLEEALAGFGELDIIVSDERTVKGEIN